MSVKMKSVILIILSGWSWLLETSSGVTHKDLCEDAMRASSFFIQSQGWLPGSIGLLDKR